ncbi:MAG: histidine kinase N-terminal 7TM domain-containing protein [Myxococcota bacterium]|nr:PAS domain-containing protein [Myxococcales bacterium]
MDPMLLQLGIAGPLVLALIVETAMRRESGAVPRTLLSLLVLIFGWMVGGVLATRPGIDPRIPAALVLPGTCFMSPLFCLLMLRYARFEIFEQRVGMGGALLAPFALFFLGFVTNDAHHWMADPGQLVVQNDLSHDIGPLYWAFQVWSNLTAIAGLAIALRLWATSPSRLERRRMLLICAGVLAPLFAHFAYVSGVLPPDASMTPSALALTCVLLVTAIQRYRLLDVQPVARRDVIEASTDGVVMADVDGIVVDANPSAARMLEAPIDALVGTRLAGAFAALEPTRPEGAVAAALDGLARGEASFAVELETGDGRTLELAGGAAADASGAFAGSFVVLRDRSQERRAARRLHQSQKLESVGILAAGVAHEVNNPLAYVRANLVHLEYLASLIDDHRDELPKELAEEVGDVQDVVVESLAGIDRIHGIVQGLLRFARMPASRDEHCDVNAAVAEASRFASLERSATVHFETRLADGLPRVAASANQLTQVLLNLFLNAKHALKGRDGGRVVAATRAVGDFVEIRIADNGPGVPEELRGKIFDPFFTTRAPNEGTGLGLSIAFDIVREHGGELELERSAEPGAHFAVRLPAVR